MKQCFVPCHGPSIRLNETVFEEISKITGKSISAVKMRIYRGLGKLKNAIKK
jgi:DNA-directed RNA polymerase specialized sigma24 family protein